MNEIVKVIKTNQLFIRLDDQIIKGILEEIKYYIKIYNKGQIIVHEDDECTSLALIIKGSVDIQRLYESGNNVLLKRLKEGDVFGEALVFSKQHKYPATVIASTNCEVLFITREDILKLCLKEKIILENFMELLSNKVLILNSKIKNISFKTIKQKVINYILEESKKQNSDVIRLNSTKEKIAEEVGVPRPSLSRELIKLRDLGYIKFNRKLITITNKNELEEKLFENN